MRTHYSTAVDDSLIGDTVRVCGWTNTRRDHGGVIFIDLRDEKGLVQLVAAPQQEAIFKTANLVRSECVLVATGTVTARPEGTINDKLASGRVEITLTELSIENHAQALPFLPNDNTSEETRLRHRVIDLRGDTMQHNIRARHKVAQAARQWLNHNDFIEIETPLLTRATPEGARDFLVPSRLQQGEFYALPQSPQLFKQMLVSAGFERYFQIARCFRDEDLRADRQPEFSQIDIEMAFVDEEIVMQLMEEFITTIFTAAGVSLPAPFPRIRWAEAMQRFGSDRPDLRNPLELTELTTAMREEEFKVFRQAAEQTNGRVAALRLPGGATLTRREIDELTAFVAPYGAKGLAYIKCNNIAAGDLQSPIVKFLSPAGVTTILEKTNAADGDMLFFGAGAATVVNASLGALRDQLAAMRNLIPENEWKPLWVVDFPLMESDGERWQALHHPFTAAQTDGEPFAVAEAGNVPAGHLATKKDNPAAMLLSRAYDVVLNGSEIGGGSIRIHRVSEQLAVLAALGIDKTEAREKFGFLLSTLESGAPPHGGIAFGLDRIMAMICGATSIREVIAFPKTQRGQCLLTGAPEKVTPQQLRDLGIQKRPAV